MTLRAAIIGTGGIASEHARTLHAAVDRVQLVAATDLDPDRLADFCEAHSVPDPLYEHVAGTLAR